MGALSHFHQIIYLSLEVGQVVLAKSESIGVVLALERVVQRLKTDANAQFAAEVDERSELVIFIERSRSLPRRPEAKGSHAVSRLHTGALRAPEQAAHRVSFRK